MPKQGKTKQQWQATFRLWAKQGITTIPHGQKPGIGNVWARRELDEMLNCQRHVKGQRRIDHLFGSAKLGSCTCGYHHVPTTNPSPINQKKQVPSSASKVVENPYSKKKAAATTTEGVATEAEPTTPAHQEHREEPRGRERIRDRGEAQQLGG